jgi:hypothetical protein
MRRRREVMAACLDIPAGLNGCVCFRRGLLPRLPRHLLSGYKSFFTVFAGEAKQSHRSRTLSG